MAGSTRQHKYGRLIQKELSEIFQRDKRGILDNTFVTISDVDMSPDLGVAKVYISMMLAKDKAQTLEKLNRGKSEIRKALGERIRKQARVVPELIFFIDETEENAFKIEELIKNLHIPPADKNQD
jgi:ribosome-binding factor A